MLHNTMSQWSLTVKTTCYKMTQASFPRFTTKSWADNIHLQYMTLVSYSRHNYVFNSTSDREKSFSQELQNLLEKYLLHKHCNAQ